VGREGTDTVPFTASTTDASLEKWVQSISEGIVPAAEAGARRAVSVMNVPFEFADVASAQRESRKHRRKGSAVVVRRNVVRTIAQTAGSTFRRAVFRYRKIRRP